MTLKYIKYAIEFIALVCILRRETMHYCSYANVTKTESSKVTNILPNPKRICAVLMSKNVS